MHLVAKPKNAHISAPILRRQTCRVLEDVISTLDLFEVLLAYAGKFDCFQIRRKNVLILLRVSPLLYSPQTASSSGLGSPVKAEARPIVPLNCVSLGFADIFWKSGAADSMCVRPDIRMSCQQIMCRRVFQTRLIDLRALYCSDDVNSNVIADNNDGREQAKPCPKHARITSMIVRVCCVLCLSSLLSWSKSVELRGTCEYLKERRASTFAISTWNFKKTLALEEIFWRLQV